MEPFPPKRGPESDFLSLARYARRGEGIHLPEHDQRTSQSGSLQLMRVLREVGQIDQEQKNVCLQPFDFPVMHQRRRVIKLPQTPANRISQFQFKWHIPSVDSHRPARSYHSLAIVTDQIGVKIKESEVKAWAHRFSLRLRRPRNDTSLDFVAVPCPGCGQEVPG